MGNLLKLVNTKTAPEVYYGLHMVPGICDYTDKDQGRVYLSESTIKQMDPSFRGKPVYIDHVEDVDPRNLEAERELDGVVVRSFFNPHDGMHWAEFVVFTDAAKQRIKQGWQLSNAYVPNGFAGGGENHAVSYDKEVTSAEYEHLALVQNPRYEESVIYTPDQFKEYNQAKEAELIRLANSKKKPKETGDMKLKLNLFKRTKTKLENALDADTVIDISEGLTGKDGKAVSQEVSFETLVNSYASVHNMHGYANGDHMVKVGEDEMSVNDLVKKHVEMCNAEKERAENADEEVEEGEEEVGDRGGDDSLDNGDLELEIEHEEPTKKNSSAEDEEEEPKEKKKNAKADDKAAAKKKAAAVRNAGPRGESEQEVATVDVMSDQIARGKTRYGSDN